MNIQSKLQDRGSLLRRSRCDVEYIAYEGNKSEKEHDRVKNGEGLRAQREMARRKTADGGDKGVIYGDLISSSISSSSLLFFTGHASYVCITLPPSDLT